MVPSNIYTTLTAADSSFKGRLPLCHTAMIPWTAEFVASIIGEQWDAAKVMEIARENAKNVYSLGGLA